MKNEPQEELESPDIRTRYAKALESLQGIQEESQLHRQLREMLKILLTFGAAGVVTISSSINTLGVSHKLKDSIGLISAIALGLTVLIALIAYFIRRISEGRVHADRIRDRVETAYLNALERSSINPKPSYTNAKRTN